MYPSYAYKHRFNGFKTRNINTEEKSKKIKNSIANKNHLLRHWWDKYTPITFPAGFSGNKSITFFRFFSVSAAPRHVVIRKKRAEQWLWTTGKVTNDSVYTSLFASSTGVVNLVRTVRYVNDWSRNLNCLYVNCSNKSVVSAEDWFIPDPLLAPQSFRILPGDGVLSHWGY